jgi:hypothetical protein
MYALLIALAFITMIIVPAVVALKVNVETVHQPK